MLLAVVAAVVDNIVDNKKHRDCCYQKIIGYKLASNSSGLLDFHYKIIFQITYSHL